VTTTSVTAFYCVIKWEFVLVSKSIYTHPHPQMPSTELLSERDRDGECVERAHEKQRRKEVRGEVPHMCEI